jgi:dolichyl-phosphate beta-glucosyltransferase
VQRPFLSIIIPAYNEENRLPHSLEKIRTFLHEQSYRAEVLVVENGSTDDTSGVVQRFGDTVDPSEPFTIRLLHSAQGKGAAVKTGMLVGQGDYLFICDADLSMPIEEVSKFLPPQTDSDQYDVAIASREAPGAVRYDEPFYRHLMGRVFNFVVRTLIIPGIDDTQCGFKCFTREAAQQIFPYQTINGWGFDPEVLYIARLRGLRVIEVPINWYYMTESRVNPIRDTINMLREVLRIRRNGGRGIYHRVKDPLSSKLVAD